MENRVESGPITEFPLGFFFDHIFPPFDQTDLRKRLKDTAINASTLELLCVSVSSACHAVDPDSPVALVLHHIPLDGPTQRLLCLAHSNQEVTGCSDAVVVLSDMGGVASGNSIPPSNKASLLKVLLSSIY
jgi:hypothetical protein